MSDPAHKPYYQEMVEGMVESCVQMCEDLLPAVRSGDKKRILELMVDHAMTTYKLLHNMKSKTGQEDIGMIDNNRMEDVKNQIIKILSQPL